MKVAGTREPLVIYQCNPEHASGLVNMEITGARNIDLYGTKCENNLPLLLVRDSEMVRVYGYGGNVAASEGSALFIFKNTPNYLVANLIDTPNRTCDENCPAIGGTLGRRP